MIQYLSNFETYLYATGYRHSTCKMAYTCVERFLNWWGKAPSKARHSDMLHWHEHLKDRPNLRRGGGLSARMIRHYLYSLRLFYNYLEQSGQVDHNPMSGFEMPKVPAHKRLILSAKEVKLLYQACEHSWQRAMLHIYYGLGLRRSEGEALLMQDVDLERGIVYVRQGKGDKWRAVPMSERMRKELLQYLIDARGLYDHDYFLINKNGRPLRGQTANRYLKQLLEKAGLPKEVTLHSLRHSIASHLLQLGLSMEQVRDFLGHQFLEATQIYLHNGLEDLD